MTEDIPYYLALNRIAGIGIVSYRLIRRTFTKLSELFSASLQSLCATGLSEKQAHAINRFDFKTIEAELRWLEVPNCAVVTVDDPAYPPLLKEIARAPLVLFVKGQLSTLNLPQLAIVGSRHATLVGCDNAYRFAAYLSKTGLTITSGLALGIDAASHRGAMQNGNTIAVLGHGLDSIYPSCHGDLAANIAEKGALVSEFPLGTKPLAGHFPRRNRLISGLSLGTLVVEATRSSGSLISAYHAIEQGREVFAMPGSIHNPLARGCHQLLRQGAKLVETAKDILEELNGFTPKATTSDKHQMVLDCTLSCDAKRVLSCVGEEVTAVDVIITRSGLACDTVLAALSHLALQGTIIALTGGYCRCPNN